MGKQRHQPKVMTDWDYILGLQNVETTYPGLSSFYLSDRRTGHRWTQDGPPNPVARQLQTLMVLGLSLSDIQILIKAGEMKAQSHLPAKMIDADLKAEVERVARWVAEQEAEAFERAKLEGKQGSKGKRRGRGSPGSAPQSSNPVSSSV